MGERKTETPTVRIEEYNSLRQEILDNFEHIKDYRTLAYTATTAIMAFSFSNMAYEEPLLCIVPIAIIVPLCVMCERCYTAIYMIDSYLMVYYSSEGFLWETRYTKFKKETAEDRKTETPGEKRRRRKKSHGIAIGDISTHEMGFISIILICFVISIYRVFSLQYTIKEFWLVKEFWFRLFVIMVVAGGAFMYIHRLGSMVKKQRLKFEKYWEKIKNNEKKPK